MVFMKILIPQVVKSLARLENFSNCSMFIFHAHLHNIIMDKVVDIFNEARRFAELLPFRRRAAAAGGGS